ncbi:unnamed protein product [Mycena citricolor]|uniref:Uncharacterized protein n=1 Tax=Mycena citricolor TaxID=2018698 RepID=A0AAD2HDP2_9AGAR|nr:unnamed protein product [Mycena citricolor]
MSENTAPPAGTHLKPPSMEIDPSRTLISPPPEEDLRSAFQTRQMNGANLLTPTAPTKAKRKRPSPTPGATSYAAADSPSKQTPNPKPRKSHRQAQSAEESPTRPSFMLTLSSPHADNPNADWLPPAPKPNSKGKARAARSPTPYEPPTDVFTPPREIFLTTPAPQSRRRAATPKPRSTTPSARARTPLRVVLSTVKIKQEPMPDIDLTRPVTPPSPSDDPILLVGSSSPAKRGRRSLPPSSDGPYNPFDWTAIVDLDAPDVPSTDSMDLDSPESFDGAAPLNGPSAEWDSDDDDGDIPEPMKTPPVVHTTPADTTTTTRKTTTPPCSLPFTHVYTTSLAAPTTPPPKSKTPPGTATGSFSSLLLRTKADPPTPRTKARAERWGVWGSPYPGRGPEEEGEGSFRMDGRYVGRDNSVRAAEVSEDEEDEDELLPEGESILRGLREEDERRAEDEQREADEESDGDEQAERDEQEAEEDKYEDHESSQQEQENASLPKQFSIGAFVTPGKGPTRVLLPSPALASVVRRGSLSPTRQTPFATRLAAAAESRFSEQAPVPSNDPTNEDDVEMNVAGPSVFSGRGLALSDTLATPSRVRVAMQPELEEDDSADLLGMVKITSMDPLAAARAVAILKAHDYDCFTRLKTRRPASFGGISKTKSPIKTPKPQVIGENVYFPGSPRPVTTTQLLEEAEKSLRTPTKPARLAREWTKHEWKMLDACFTDERIDMAEKMGMTLRHDETPERAVLMASADAVDLDAVVNRFVQVEGDHWDRDAMMQRAQALQNKQRAGNVAPPTPRTSLVSPQTPSPSAFNHTRRKPSMVVPDFTPPGRRAMPPRKSHVEPLVPFPTSGRARFPAPVGGSSAPFSGPLPPTPEPARNRRLPGSLLAPRYSHLLEEARVVARDEPDEGEEEGNEEEEKGGEGEEDEEEPSRDAEMPPATPLRVEPPAPPASIGKRVKGFLFSYLSSSAKPAAKPSMVPTGRPRLPLPPKQVKPRGPITTPARPAPVKARPPKDLVHLHAAPKPAPAAVPRPKPQRMVELNHVELPAEKPVSVRPRTSSGGSVKDLVKGFESMQQQKEPLKRARSVVDLRGKGTGRPAWR